MSIGSSLADHGLISSDQFQIGVIESGTSGKPLERTLVDLGFITEKLLRDFKGESTGAASVDLSSVLPDPMVLEIVPEDFARRYSLIPLSCENRQFRVAMCDSADLLVLDKLERLLDKRWKLQPVLASERDIVAALDRFYGFELSIDGILKEIETGHVDSTAVVSSQQNHTHPFVRLVDAILTDAVKRHASDIHFEPEAGFLRVRYRIDGLMRQVRSLHYQYWPAIAVRLKVLAELDIAESRAPQDGRMSFAIAGGNVEFRVSALPTVHGENIVLRILDREKGIVALDSLEFRQSALQSLNALLARPEGLILVTGPTGSGKTTTLYSMLSKISSEHTNIMTMEDPVEYPLPLLRQTSVNDQLKLDFASGIRAILRQDPDVILVGEIRDQETAGMALRASMTGHQVFSTLHANSALGALARLHGLGIRKSEIVGNLIGIVGQRLVRKLCSHCKVAVNSDSTSVEFQQFQAVGCELCDHQGYAGRLALLEVLAIDDDIESCFLAEASPAELLEAATGNGFEPIASDAIDKVRQGLTSFEEASRVVNLSTVKSGVPVE